MKASGENSKEEEERKKITIDKDLYQKTLKVLKPNYLKEEDIKKQESFYEEFNSLESLN